MYGQFTKKAAVVQKWPLVDFRAIRLDPEHYHTSVSSRLSSKTTNSLHVSLLLT